MPLTIIIGAQWGDEGKGHITDRLAQGAAVVARYSGGDNAGHTVTIGILEHRVIGSVHDVQSVLIPEHAEDGGEVLAKDGLDGRTTARIPANQNDAIDPFRRGTARVHGIFTDKQIPLRVASHGRWMLDIGDTEDQVDLEPCGCLLSARLSTV